MRALTKDVIDLLEPHTTMTHARLSGLYGLAHLVLEERIGGAFVECGTATGGSAAVLARAIRERDPRQLWLFDSFQGLPAPDAVDVEWMGPIPARALVGAFAGSELQVRLLLERTGAAMGNVHIVPGWFADTLRQTETGPIALLHVDADLHSSTREVLEALYPRVTTPGGLVVVDDYGRWPGSALAVDEFLEPGRYELELIDGCSAWWRTR